LIQKELRSENINFVDVMLLQSLTEFMHRSFVVGSKPRFNR